MVHSRSARNLLDAGILAVVYFLAGKLGLKLAFLHASATPVWPPAGIALAAFLVLGYRIWPGVLIGAFLVNLTTAGTVATSLGIAVGNTLEGLLAAYLVNRFARGRHVFERPQDVAKFVVLAAMISTVVSTTFGVTSLALGGFANWSDYGSIWLTWWLGDAASDLVVAPLLLVWSTGLPAGWKRRRLFEAVALFLCLLVVGQAVFGGLFPPIIQGDPLEYVCVPFLLWAAFRFGQRGATMAVFALSGMAIWGTLQGFGPFVGKTQNESLLLLQAFVGVTSAMTLAVAAVVSERNCDEEALRTAQNELEQQVRQRTKDLSAAIEALQADHEKFLAVAETANDAIVCANSRGDITYFNQAAGRMFGHAPEEVAGRPLTVLMPKRFHDPHRQGLGRLVSTGESHVLGKTVELAGSRKDGSEFPLELSLASWRTGGGTFFTGIMRDITERKEAALVLERQASELARSNAELTAMNKELDAFTYSVSHDLRAPLRQIDGFSKILFEEFGPGPEPQGQQCVKRIQEGVRQMARLIDDLLNLGRLGRAALHLRSVKLNELVRQVVAELEPETKGRHIEWRIGALPGVECDPALMKLVLANLLSNAVKYTRPQEVALIEVDQMMKDGELVIFVRDNGVGFNMRYAHKLFGIFQRLHLPEEFEGTGVGLATVQRVIHKHGGRVWAEAEPNKGATFCFTVGSDTQGKSEINAKTGGEAWQPTR